MFQIFPSTQTEQNLGHFKASLTFTTCGGEQAQLIGYGATNNFASRASTLITARLTEFDFGHARYTDLVEARSVTDSRTCNGDSGDPVYINDTIYAVHTAGGYNPDCMGGGKTDVAY